MADLKDVKLAYSSAQKRIRVELPVSVCKLSKTPPQDLIDRASGKFESELQQGHIDAYILYQDLFFDLWGKLHELFKEKNSERVLSVMLGEGFRKVEELTVKDAKDPERTSCLMTLTGDANQMTNIRFDWLLAQMRDHCQKKGFPPPHEAQVKGAWLRATQGKKIEELPIGISPEPEKDLEKGYKMLANRSRGEVSIVIHDHTIFREKERLNEIIHACKETARKLSDEKTEYQFLKEDVTQALKACLHGPELFGVGMPLVMLVATSRKAAKKKPKSAANASTKQESYPGAGFLEIDVDEEGLEASIASFSLEWYQSSSGFTPDDVWLRNELKRLGLKVENEKNLAQIQKGLKECQDVTGMVITKGTPGTPPSGAFLHKSYLDMKMDDDSTEDLRDAQGRNVVQPGDLVFEVRYKNPGKPGKNVYGETTPIPEGDPLVVDIGPGIDLREGGRYFATIEGMPLFEDNQLSISQVYHHRGNINLKSGNVYFNGPARIEGNIESGATVMVKGDLTVTGSVEGAFVRSGGSITVKNGIVTTERGRVQARENIHSNYIGNSNIICGGDLFVRKAALNSQIIVGGNINLEKKEGTLAGGQISCRGNISAGKVGFPKGDKTYILAGVDWRTELSLQTKRNRLKRLKEAEDTDRKAMRELIRKKAAQMTAKHKAQKDELQERVTKIRGINDKLLEQIQKLEEMVNWDKDVKIYAHELLCTNVEITVGGTQVKVPGDVAGVFVSAKRSRGSYVHPIEEDEEGQDEAS